jgi:hypothetical protein
MAYEFQAVDISVFDYHEMLAPLTGPGLTRPAFNFLTDPAQYDAFYKAGQAIQSAHFDARPLPWRTLSFHHFWKHYQTIWYPGGQPEFWKLQMPVICKPRGAEFEVVTGLPGVTGRVRPTVFLFPHGWSNNLDISLRGRMTADELRDFVGRLLRQKAAVFTVDGVAADGAPMQKQPMTLPQVFSLLSAQLGKDVYVPNLVSTLRLKHYAVITLAEFDGEQIRYYLSQRPGTSQMPEAGRRVMHAILGGEPVSVAQLLGMERRQAGHRRFLLTRFNEADFAITYFDYGTLVFWQETSVAGFQPPQKKEMRCRSSNLRNYLIMTHALLWFYKDTAAEKDPKVVALRGHVATDLQQMPSKFINPFSITFHDAYVPSLGP